MGNIAKAAGERTRACAGYTAAAVRTAELERSGELLGYVAAYRPGLSADRALCDRGEPVTALKLLE